MLNKPQIIILSDPYQLDTVRYMGPYVVKNHLKAAGFDVVVIDYFTRFDTDQEFFDYLANFVSDRLAAVMISTTFTYSSPTDFAWARSEMGRHITQDQTAKQGWWDYVKASSLYLWKGDNDSLNSWFSGVRKVLADNHAKDAKIVLGGERLNWIYKFDHRSLPEDYALKQTDLCVLGRVDLFIGDLVSRLVKNSLGEHRLHISKKNDINFYIPPPHLQYSHHKHDIPDSTFGLEDAVLPGEWLPFENARGCAFNCKYCNYDKGHSQKKSMEQTRAEFMRNYELHGTTGYSFTCECFNDDYQYVKDFHAMVKTLPFELEWNGYARFDLSHKYQDLAELTVDSGGRSLIIGIETLNWEVGKKMGRGLKPERVLELADQYKRAGEKHGGIHLKGCFIIGLPGETRESQEATNKFISEQTYFNAVLGNVLEVMPYEEDLSNVFDFAGINVDPSKYGFEELTFDPYYWRHQTMDVYQAIDMNYEFNEANLKNPYTYKYNNGKRNVNLFFYSAMRSLGYTHLEAMDKFHNVPEVYDQCRDKIKRYHDLLLTTWCK
jgi:hypothetical protein